MASFWQHLLNFFFPLTCASCGRLLPAESVNCLCSECWMKMEFISPHFCQSCGQVLPDGGRLCFLCRKNTYHFEYVRAVCKYNETIKKAIYKFKYQKQNFLYKYLGKLLVDYLNEEKETGDKTDLIIPVPLHWFRYYKRGFNQSGLLAKKLAENLSKPVMVQNLRRIRGTKPQYNLSLEMRKENIVGAFIVKNKESIKNKNILLVDDICTTTITLNECARVLKKAGANKIYCLVLARD